MIRSHLTEAAGEFQLNSTIGSVIWIREDESINHSGTPDERFIVRCRGFCRDPKSNAEITPLQKYMPELLAM